MNNNCSRNQLILIGLGGFLVLVIIISLAVVLTRDDDDDIIRLDEETIIAGDDGDNKVQIIFGELPTDAEIVSAFESASNRWSAIIANTVFPTVTIEANDELSFCNVAALTDDFIFDHLLIAASFGPVDGPGQTLAFAAPCTAFGSDNTGTFPMTGIMVFDDADIDLVAGEGSIEDVILHEMGHVLGIGTLWAASIQNQILANDPEAFYATPEDEFLLQDPVIDIISGQVDPTARPFFIGQEAERRFDLAKGGDGNNPGTVPVEDGIFPQGNNFNNANGAGSVDGHWNLEDFVNELMVFSLVDDMRLSEVTIASLQDLGYTVDFNEADDFVIQNINARGAQKEEEKGKHHLDMHNDILHFPLTVKYV